MAERPHRARANFFLYAVCSIITVVAYTQINIDDTMMLFLGFPLGFFASGIFSRNGSLPDPSCSLPACAGRARALPTISDAASRRSTHSSSAAERPPAAWPLDWRIRHPRLWHSDLRGIAATRNARASADGRRALTLAARAVPEPNVLRPSARRSQTRRRLSPSGMLAKRKDVSSGSTRRSASALRSQQASRGSPTRARRASKPAPLSSTLDRHRSCLHPMCRADTCSTHAPFAEPTVVCETAMGPLVPTLAVSYI